MSALPYQYAPLMPDGSTFRVVTILPGKPNDKIECFFLEVPVTAKPRYSALSYTWGSPTLVAHVWIYERSIAIGQNLKDALHRLRDSKDMCNFWIDALCINQQDQEEKANQIPLMREIYSKAQLVVLYLGPEKDGSDTVPSLLDRIDRAYDLCQEAGYQHPFTALPINKRELFELPDLGDQIWKNFKLFLDRDWFTRIWVIQEVTLATSAKLICGQWSISWIFFLSIAFKALSLRLFGIRDEEKSVSSTPNNRPNSIEQLIFLSSLRPGGLQFVPLKLIDLLHQARIALATKPEDYCYGLIGISRELHNPSFTIDSSLPVEAVYRQFSRCLVMQGDAIRVLYNSAGHTIIGLPSWVPDWSHRRLPPLRIAPPPHREPLSNPAVASALDRKPMIRLHPGNPDILTARVLLFDQINGLGHLYQVTETQSPMKDYSSERKLITELQEFLYQTNRSPYLNKEDHETIIWRTLICNHRPNSSAEAPEIYLESYRAILWLAKSFDQTWNIPHSPEINSKTLQDLIEEDPADLLSQAQVINGAVMKWCDSRRRGKTERGYVGQFCADAQIGDMICIPLGSAVPFVIRPSVEGMYNLIGECYVHGIMHGEAFDDPGNEVTDIHFT